MPPTYLQCLAGCGYGARVAVGATAAVAGATGCATTAHRAERPAPPRVLPPRIERSPATPTHPPARWRFESRWT